MIFNRLVSSDEARLDMPPFFKTINTTDRILVPNFNDSLNMDLVKG